MYRSWRGWPQTAVVASGMIRWQRGTPPVRCCRSSSTATSYFTRPSLRDRGLPSNTHVEACAAMPDQPAWASLSSKRNRAAAAAGDSAPNPDRSAPSPAASIVRRGMPAVRGRASPAARLVSSAAPVPEHAGRRRVDRQSVLSTTSSARTGGCRAKPSGDWATDLYPAAGTPVKLQCSTSGPATVSCTCRRGNDTCAGAGPGVGGPGIVLNVLVDGVVVTSVAYEHPRQHLLRLVRERDDSGLCHE